MMSSPDLRHRDDVLGLADGHEPERLGDDRHVRDRRALFQHHRPHLGAVIFEQLGRTHVAGDENGVLRQFLAAIAGAVAGQHAQQAVGEIVEVVQPILDVGSVDRIIRARVSFCTRSTAASAVRPLLMASSSRATQPRSFANMR